MTSRLHYLNSFISLSVFLWEWIKLFKLTQKLEQTWWLQCLSFSCPRSASRFTSTYFSINNKNENHFNSHYFPLYPGPGVRWERRSQSQRKSSCLRFEMSQLCSRRERLLHLQGRDLSPLQPVLPESRWQRLVSWSLSQSVTLLN